MFHSYIPRKHQKTEGFGSIEVEHWFELGYWEEDVFSTLTPLFESTCFSVYILQPLLTITFNCVLHETTIVLADGLN